MSITTKAALLSFAEIQMRTKGYAAFSYADLAAEVRITKASIHHHFPTKERLGLELIDDYVSRFDSTLTSIEAEHTDPIQRLQAFSRLFVMSADDGLLPLCGALGAEMAALPLSLQKLAKSFFTSQLDWLQITLNRAVQQYNWSLKVSVEQFALMLLSVLEGVSLIDWTLGRSADPLAGFNYLLETAAAQSSFLRIG